MSQTLSKLPEVVPAGDAAVLILFSDEVSIEISARVHQLAWALEKKCLEGVRELIPARSSLMLEYDPLVLSFEEIRSVVEGTSAKGLGTSMLEGRLREIPVVYGGLYGPDLASVSQYHGMSDGDVVRLHSSVTYVVAALAFAPGQPSLIGLPAQLAMPRRESPRQLVPAGTLAITNQATIYTLAGPGGAMLVGRTHCKLFDPWSDPPTYLQPGDRVRFVPIAEDDYLGLGGVRAE